MFQLQEEYPQEKGVMTAVHGYTDKSATVAPCGVRVAPSGGKECLKLYSVSSHEGRSSYDNVYSRSY